MTDVQRLMMLERRMAEMERRQRLNGVGTNNLWGSREVRATQTGFPVKITGPFDVTGGEQSGYPWEQLDVNRNPTGGNPGIVPYANNPRTGYNAFTVDNNLTLDDGAVGWLDIDPESDAWIFTSAPVIPIPVLLTSGFSSTTGYDWTTLVIDVANQTYQPSEPPIDGNKLVFVDNDQTLQPGRACIMVPDPTTPGQWMGQLWPLPLVKNVCPVFTSGVLTDIVVESWQPEPNAGLADCVTDPDNCDCPPPVPPGNNDLLTCLSCTPGGAAPIYFKILSGCVALNGNVYGPGSSAGSFALTLTWGNPLFPYSMYIQVICSAGKIHGSADISGSFFGSYTAQTVEFFDVKCPSTGSGTCGIVSLSNFFDGIQPWPGPNLNPDCDAAPIVIQWGTNTDASCG